MSEKHQSSGQNSSSLDGLVPPSQDSNSLYSASSSVTDASVRSQEERVEKPTRRRLKKNKAAELIEIDNFDEDADIDSSMSAVQHDQIDKLRRFRINKERMA